MTISKLTCDCLCLWFCCCLDILNCKKLWCDGNPFMSPGTPLLVPSLGGGHLHLPMRTVFARPYGSMKGLTSLGSHKSGGGGIGGGGGTELCTVQMHKKINHMQ